MKKKFLAIFILAAVTALGVMSAALTACSAVEEYSVWDVSAEGGNVTASFADNGKYGYILTVSGSGAMQDYSSAKDTPWYGKSGRITELVIEDGVTQIGDNAFTYCYYADEVILPASVTSVGKNAFPESSKVYCKATDVTAGEGTAVYVYSENQPTVGGNFWHSVNGTPAVWPYVVTSAQKILFIGNSYTFYNDMPTLFKEIANAARADVTVESITTGSQSLKNWADPKTADGARVEAALTSSNDYDIVVLQEKSTSPVNDDYRYFLSGARALTDRIRETQDDCRVFLYETWGSPAYAGNYGGSVSEMESRLRSAYDTVAERVGATVSYVGKAFTYAYENYSDIILYNTEDDNHPSYEGSYLAACVHATTLLGLNVENSTYNGTLDGDTAALLREIGYKTVVGADIPKITYDMQIAVYTRYADASTVSDLVAAFKEDYAEKNGVAAPKIKYSMLGASNTAVAAFGKLVNAGNYDIVFGTGNNINTDGGVSVLAKKTYSVVSAAYTGTRYISYLTENEIAVAFYNFMDTDEAKVILDPGYVPDGEAQTVTVNLVVNGSPYGEAIVVSNATGAPSQSLPKPEADTGFVFKGWATTRDEVADETLIAAGAITYKQVEQLASEGALTLYARFAADDGPQTVTIVIGYYNKGSNALTNEQLKAIEKAFTAYALEEGVNVKMTFTPYDDMDVMNSDAAAKQLDYVINVGNKISAANGVSGTKIQVGNRYVMQIADNEISALFHRFALQDETIGSF